MASKSVQRPPTPFNEPLTPPEDSSMNLSGEIIDHKTISVNLVDANAGSGAATTTAKMSATTSKLGGTNDDDSFTNYSQFFDGPYVPNDVSTSFSGLDEEEEFDLFLNSAKSVYEFFSGLGANTSNSINEEVIKRMGGACNSF